MNLLQQPPGATGPQTGAHKINGPQLMPLFEKELKSIYWAEKALTRALPAMAGHASSPHLEEALKTHLRETIQQVQKVETVFSLIGQEPAESKCEAMASLLNSGEETMAETAMGALRDTEIIAASRKVEHHEMACYGLLRTYALWLGFGDAAAVLGGILDEEKNADAVLSAVGETIYNNGKGPGISEEENMH